MEGLLLGRGFHESPPQTEVSYKLPSLQEFDQGVQALVDANSPPSNPFPQSSPSFNDVFKPQLHSFQTYQAPEERLPAASSPYVSSPADHHAGCAPCFSSSPSLYHTPRAPYTALLPGSSTPKLSPEELYPRAKSKKRGKPYKKPYTLEEGDFIIYFKDDKKCQWREVQSKFVRTFGFGQSTQGLDRSMQGLQTLYYRAKAVIPCWDSQGYLIFENDNIAEPKMRKIRRKGNDNANPVTLAERNPERGVAYSWVDYEDKIAMSDWANKRIQQFNERRESLSKEARRALDMQHGKLQEILMSQN